MTQTVLSTFGSGSVSPAGKVQHYIQRQMSNQMLQDWSLVHDGLCTACVQVVDQVP